MNVQNSSALSSRGGWWPIVREPFQGAWQRNMEQSQSDVVANPTVWSCVTLIARDVSRLWVKVVQQGARDVWTPVQNSAYSPVLRSPNHYQTRVKFFEYWMCSKLLRGNTYVLKERNNRGAPDAGNVRALYILDPSRVQVLVAQDGSVFYQLATDYLSGVTEGTVTMPASEIIHDVYFGLYHPLAGVSPIYASGMAAIQGLNIQQQSSNLFQRGSQPSGVLTAPSIISNEVADRIRLHWESNYAGPDNVGKVAVLGDGLHYEPMTMSAVDAQLIDQLKWSDERIAATFHVPGYKIDIGAPPPYTDIQSINLEYYNQALAPDIENLEELLTKGLEMANGLAVEFDLRALLRMDTKTQTEVIASRIGAGFYTPNEARAELDLTPVDGGDTPYMQQQNWPLRMLEQRQLPAEQPAVAKLPAPDASSAPPAAKEIEIELKSDEIGEQFRKELLAA